MAATVPTKAPAQLIAGDTAKWKITLPDYPAGEDWALSYALVRRSGGVRILISSSADGDDHLVNVAPTETVGYLPGVYDVQAFAANSGTGERYAVWTGVIAILQNFATAEDGYDTRSQARKIFDSLEAAILKIATAQQTGSSGGLVEWQAEGLRIKRSSPDLLLAELTKQRDRYAAICASEDAAAARAAGRGTGRRVLIQFGAPR